MSVIEVNFRGSKFSLHCNDAQKAQAIAQALETRAAEITNAYKGGITDLRALFLTAMIMQDEIVTLQQKLEATQHTSQTQSSDKQSMATSFDKVSQYITSLTELVESNIVK